MDHAVPREYWDGRGLVMLVGAILLAPFAWLLDLQVSYSLVKWACAHDARELLVSLPVGSLLLTALGGWMSWSCWGKIDRQANGAGGGIMDRNYLLAVTGLALNGLFALLILTSLAPRLLLSPCE